MAFFAGYCSVDDVLARGIPPQAATVSPRRVSGADPATGTLTLRGHGLVLGVPLTFQVVSSSIPGEPAAALMGGISEVLSYEAVPVSGSSDLFNVRLPGGPTITSFSSAHVGQFAMTVDVRSMIPGFIASFAGWMHAHMPNYRTPVLVGDDGNYPEILAELNERGAGLRLLRFLGLQHPQYKDAAQPFIDQGLVDQGLLNQWQKGQPIPGVVKDQTPTITEMGAVLVSLSTSGGFDLPDGRV